MSKQDARVEIQKLEDNIIELRYFDTPRANSYFSWKMPINEVNDLARWWTDAGRYIKKNQLPIVEHKFRSILISMFTHARADIRGFDRHGGLKLLGYSLPIKVLEHLGIWLQDRQQSQKSNGGRRRGNV